MQKNPYWLDKEKTTPPASEIIKKAPDDQPTGLLEVVIELESNTTAGEDGDNAPMVMDKNEIDVINPMKETTGPLPGDTPDDPQPIALFIFQTVERLAGGSDNLYNAENEIPTTEFPIEGEEAENKEETSIPGGVIDEQNSTTIVTPTEATVIKKESFGRVIEYVPPHLESNGDETNFSVKTNVSATAKFNMGMISAAHKDTKKHKENYYLTDIWGWRTGHYFNSKYGWFSPPAIIVIKFIYFTLFFLH